MKIKHVYVTAQEPGRLETFYSNIGLPLRFADGDRWVQFRSEGAAFCVAGIEESVSAPSSNAVVVFEVERLETVVERAVQAGAVVVKPVRDMGEHGRVAQIRDPENNLIQFFEPRPKTA